MLGNQPLSSGPISGAGGGGGGSGTGAQGIVVIIYTAVASSNMLLMF